MSTRSSTMFIEGNRIVCHIYRQCDGYPTGHGLELARACNVKLLDGVSSAYTVNDYANGIGCLAATAVGKLKQQMLGNVYLAPPDEKPCDWVEYVYIVRQTAVGKPPSIECSTKSGSWPFNLQNAGHVFTGTPAAWIAKYEAEKLAKEKPTHIATIFVTASEVVAKRRSRKTGAAS